MNKDNHQRRYYVEFVYHEQWSKIEMVMMHRYYNWLFDEWDGHPNRRVFGLDYFTADYLDREDI